MKAKQQVEVTEAEEKEVLRPESVIPTVVAVGGKQISIRPLSFRWQTQFWAAAMPIYDIELSSIERIFRIIQEGAFTGASMAGEIIQSEIDSIGRLGRAAAVILAAQIPGSDKDTEAFITEQHEWVMGSSNVDELRLLVDLQADKERLVQRVGERLPTRCAKLLNLIGDTTATADSVKQLLTTLFLKSQASNGAGS